MTERALVVIARGLAQIEDTEHDGQVLVLDEPTAYLPHDGVERLFRVVRDLTATGVSVLFVSHRLDEVLDLCDRVLVLRNGRLVADETLDRHDHRSLVELMLGRLSDDLYAERGRTSRSGSCEIAVEDLRGPSCRGVSFEAHAGDVIGFVGLPGSGYDEIPYLLAGATRASGGRMTVAGRSVDIVGLSARSAIRHGVALIPADRKAASGAVALSVKENMTLPSLHRFARARAVIRGRDERRAVDHEIVRFDVHPPRSDLALALMSGGNQQKVLIAKFLGSPTVMALHEPTQGVDLGAKREVFAHLAAAAERGQVVLVSSVELEDLVHLCDRVHVLRAGRIVSTLEGAELTSHAIAADIYAGDAATLRTSRQGKPPA